jgi:hypothetical protein
MRWLYSSNQNADYRQRHDEAQYTPMFSHLTFLLWILVDTFIAHSCARIGPSAAVLQSPW